MNISFCIKALRVIPRIDKDNYFRARCLVDIIKLVEMGYKSYFDDFIFSMNVKSIISLLIILL